MQIVIEISNYDKEWITNGYYIPEEINLRISEAIANGTPLPKGHGRLKDIDEIYWYGCTTEDDCPYKNRDCKDCDRGECSKTQVDSIPVLIPADKEGED